MKSAYIETSILSYASARINANPAVFALQEQARKWWLHERLKYQLYTSEFVIAEASLGDAAASALRLEMLDGIPVLPRTPEVETLATEILTRSLMPTNAKLDALHIASAAVARVDYLLTLNCRHIANAHNLPRVYNLLDEMGLSGMLVCTPAEFLGDLEP